MLGSSLAHAYEDLAEKPAQVYVSEVMHHWEGEAYTQGGGLFYIEGSGGPHEYPIRCIAGRSLDEARDNFMTMVDRGIIDYHGVCTDGHKSKVGDTAIYALRAQFFVNRCYVGVASGISRGEPKLEAMFDAPARCSTRTSIRSRSPRPASGSTGASRSSTPVCSERTPDGRRSGSGYRVPDRHRTEEPHLRRRRKGASGRGLAGRPRSGTLPRLTNGRDAPARPARSRRPAAEVLGRCRAGVGAAEPGHATHRATCWRAGLPASAQPWIAVPESARDGAHGARSLVGYPIRDNRGTPAKHAKTTVGDVRLHYVTAGTGEPVVLLHGIPKTLYYWRLLIPLLSERYTVIAIDMRGFGTPAGPSTASTCGPSQVMSRRS